MKNLSEHLRPLRNFNLLSGNEHGIGEELDLGLHIEHAKWTQDMIVMEDFQRRTVIYIVEYFKKAATVCEVRYFD